MPSVLGLPASGPGSRSRPPHHHRRRRPARAPIRLTLLEAHDGRDRYRQVTRLARPEVIRLRPRALAPQHRPPRHCPRVMRPHDSQAVEDVIEVAVLVRIDFASALVARVELAGPDAWCCTAIRLGQNHMHRSSSSALRRTLAGLLLDEQTFAAQRRRSWLGHSVATA